LPEVVRVLPAQATAHVLIKQGLAGRRLPTVLDAVAATAGIYSTAPTCYLSGVARVEKFRLADLDRELYADRSIARVRCVRGMAYIQPLELMPVLFACTGEAKDRTVTRIGKWSGLGEEGALAFADRIEAAMAGRPPVTVRELRELIGPCTPEEKDALQYVVALLGRFGRIVRSEVRGGWRSDTYAYALWNDWTGAPVDQMDPAQARIELTRRYLRAFGPATTDDLKWWTGWTKRDTVPALTALGDEIVPVSVDGADSWVLAEELEVLTGVDPGAARSVRLLPVWDAYFMAYASSPAGRARQVAEADYPRTYDKAGNGTSAVAQDGVAAGVWELDSDQGTVTVAPFSDALRWDEVAAEVAVLAQAIGTELRLVRSPEPGPLSAGPRNAFLSPITLCLKS
jgi:hypothetical protein